MRKTLANEVWKRKTVQFAISLLRLIQVMQAVAEVELRAPAPCAPCSANVPKSSYYLRNCAASAGRATPSRSGKSQI